MKDYVELNNFFLGSLLSQPGVVAAFGDVLAPLLTYRPAGKACCRGRAPRIPDAAYEAVRESLRAMSPQRRAEFKTAIGATKPFIARLRADGGIDRLIL